MVKKLKDIINESTDLFSINVIKPDKHDRSTWIYKMTDKRWKGEWSYGEKMKMVHLRRDNAFFLAYKGDDPFKYFVDEKKSMYRSSVIKYINSQVQYSVYSNDISYTKNDPSFKISQIEMKNMGINNFLDLCYHYMNYTAIGTGYTRNLRNLVVMDIDVDCTKPDNKIEIQNLLNKFASYSTLPDFCIFNKESKHMQMQWLIQDFTYKDINWDVVNQTVDELIDDPDKNKEVDHRKCDFMKMSDSGIKFRKFTRAMCDIVKKRKFGDKNYTFWKAKNPMSALKGMCELELKMPYMEDGEIKYRTQEEMDDMFSTQEKRNKYFSNAYHMDDIFSNLSELIDPLMEKIKDKEIEKIIDGDDIKKKKIIKIVEKKEDDDESGKSRNNFVFTNTRDVTLQTARKMGYRNSDSIKDLTREELKTLRENVFNEVKRNFDAENKKYGGIWPGTTNISEYSLAEFKSTFDSVFQYTISHFKNTVYTDDDRKKSFESRHIKKDGKLLIVDKLRNTETLKRAELLERVNKELKKTGQKGISMGTLKRYINESKNMSQEKRDEISEEYRNEYMDRKKKLKDAISEGKSQKEINTCKKRYEYLNIKNT